MLMAILLGCAAKTATPEQYFNPIAVQLDEVEREEEDQLLVLLGVQNLSTASIVVENVTIEVSGHSESLDYYITVPESEKTQIRMTFPISPSLDQVRVAGVVRTLDSKDIALFDRTIDLIDTEHHHH